MSRKKGRMIYVPPSIIDVAERVKERKNYNKRSRAFDDVAKYARVGIEAERIYNLDFGIRKKLNRRRKR